MPRIKQKSFHCPTLWNATSLFRSTSRTNSMKRSHSRKRNVHMIVEWSALWECVLWWIFRFLMILTKTLKCGEVDDFDLLYLILQAADLSNAHGSTKPSFRPATSPPFWSFPSASCLLLKQLPRCFQVAYFLLAFWVPLKCWSFSDVVRLSECGPSCMLSIASWLFGWWQVLTWFSAVCLCCWWSPATWSAVLQAVADDGLEFGGCGGFDLDDHQQTRVIGWWWQGGCSDFNLDDHQLTRVIGWWWQGDDKVDVVVLTLMTISWPRWSDDADRVMTRWTW